MNDWNRPSLQTAQVVEPLEGDWSTDGRFGRRIDQLFPAEGTLISIANADHLPGPPRARAVNLFRSDGVQPAAFNAQFRMRCTYGAGGIVNQFDADWIHGGQFNVVAESVRIDALTYRPRPAPAPYVAPAGNVVLGYTIGDGAVNPSLPLTFTPAFVDVATGGGSAAFAVPDFGRKARPYIFDTVILYTDYQILLEDGTGPRFDATFSEAMFLEGLSLPGWVERVRVVNNTGAATAPVTVQFELGL